MKLLILVVTVGTFLFANAQPIPSKPFEFPFKVKVYDLPESSNGINYRLYVRPPLIAPKTSEKASCFFFLDALRLFVPASAMTSNYEYYNYHPAAYFIGIGYQNEEDGIPKEINRIRDYTPTTFSPTSKDHFLANNAKEYKNSGGCDAFLDVVQNEIIPFINKHFDVGDDRVLIGNSMSGLAAVHAFLTRPNLFNRYVIVSPSIWWDDWFYPREKRYVMKQLKMLDESMNLDETRIYFAVGEAEEQFGMVTDLYVLVNSLKTMQLKKIKTHLEVLQEEQHEGVFPGAFMKGILGVYTEEENRRKSFSRIEWK